MEGRGCPVPDDRVCPELVLFTPLDYLGFTAFKNREPQKALCLFVLKIRSGRLEAEGGKVCRTALKTISSS